MPVPGGASADSASVPAARESEHQPPRPHAGKRLRGASGAVKGEVTHLRSIAR